MGYPQKTAQLHTILALAHSQDENLLESMEWLIWACLYLAEEIKDIARRCFSQAIAAVKSVQWH